jgi:nucleoside-diphosphate-sugar epimerase
MSRQLIVTGSCGLIGSRVAVFFSRHGYQVTGIDDNHGAIFWGPQGDTGFKELGARWDYANPPFEKGIAEDFSVDQSKIAASQLERSGKTP